MLGVRAPSEGQVKVLGRAPNDPQVRRQLGYLPENVTFYPQLSGRETLRHFARLKGAALSQVDELLEQVGLHHEGGVVGLGKVGQTRQRGGNANFQLVAPYLRGFRHFLLLHGIHARQPADRLLIKRHNALAVLTALILAFDIAQQIGEPVAEYFLASCIHIQNYRHQPLCFGKTDYL